VLARAEERKRRAEPADARTYAFARVVLRLLFGLCVGPEIVGRENVPRRGPLLVVGNHLSFLEPPLMTVAVPRRITYLALYELFDIGWLAPALRVMGALPVKRGGARDLDALRAALHLLERDEAVGIFPEGERSIQAGLLRANPGVSLLVTRSGATILPVAITGTERLTSIPALLLARLRRRRVRIVIGRPFRPTVAGARPDHQALADEIMGEVAALLPPAYRGAYADAAPSPAAQRAPGAPAAASEEQT
jgi:1-acyl-sn-glycerol-3-phosphate acyltransferase